jgi:hypothetical protein
MESLYVAHASLELLDSSIPLASAYQVAEVIGVHHYTQSIYFNLKRLT